MISPWIPTFPFMGFQSCLLCCTLHPHLRKAVPKSHAPWRRGDGVTALCLPPDHKPRQSCGLTHLGRADGSVNACVPLGPLQALRYEREDLSAQAAHPPGSHHPVSAGLKDRSALLFLCTLKKLSDVYFPLLSLLLSPPGQCEVKNLCSAQDTAKKEEGTKYFLQPAAWGAWP